ncbi:MAG: 16S rRNA (cytidine(1402)-2'-O)-methyltransferase [Legionellaceae bacterium]|nr:16S rRNA (cytidine(1402)-2'-O)-methyltransferase [Legionellaceae bacterium]
MSEKPAMKFQHIPLQDTHVGTLYVVATPIGNLGDITFRAIETLQKVQLILAEDTRHAARLLQHYQIETPVRTLHLHNEHQSTDHWIDYLRKGNSIALISDAGTPLISDPGFPLIKEARLQQLPVTPIPGACAAITALSAAGVPCDHFYFAGFLPHKTTARIQVLESLKLQTHTSILYEAPHRIIACIQDIAKVYGDSYCFSLAKELTKTFEHFEYGNAATLLAWFEKDSQRLKGEFVLLLPGVASESSHQEMISVSLQQLLALFLPVYSMKDAAANISKISGLNKNFVYEQALALKK